MPTTTTLGRIPTAGHVCFLVENLHDGGLEKWRDRDRLVVCVCVWNRAR